jgi:hypothetical protein
MTLTELLIGLGYTLWLMVCALTAVVKGRGLGWAVAASLFPPLWLVLLWLKPGNARYPTRERCPLCHCGWVPLDRLPRICSGCGKEVTHVQLQDEMHRDML